MKYKFLKATLAGLILTAATFANAGLIIEINDNAGKAEFTFSGSDIIVTDSHMNNGLWLHSLEFSDIFNQHDGYLGNDYDFIESASWSLNGIEYTFGDIFLDARISSYVMGFRSHSNPFDVVAGTTISLQGSFVSMYDFNIFKEGVYESNYIGPYEQNRGLLRDGLTMNIGSVEVPEPSTLTIFALGVIGLASRRFKKQF